MQFPIEFIWHTELLIRAARYNFKQYMMTDSCQEMTKETQNKATAKFAMTITAKVISNRNIKNNQWNWQACRGSKFIQLTRIGKPFHVIGKPFHVYRQSVISPERCENAVLKDLQCRWWQIVLNKRLIGNINNISGILTKGLKAKSTLTSKFNIALYKALYSFRRGYCSTQILQHRLGQTKTKSIWDHGHQLKTKTEV